MARKKRKDVQKNGEDSNTEKDICFVIMPFGGWLDEYYRTIYCPAIIAAGIEPHRADDLFRPSTIVNDIWTYTKRAKLVLADLTGKNQNVFYELGLAHALAKPVILIAESMQDVPFDLQALRVLIYDKNAPSWGAILKEKIEAAIAEVLKAPAEAILPAFLNIRDRTPSPTVTTREKEIIELRQQIERLRDDILLSSAAQMEQLRAELAHSRSPSRIAIPAHEARALIRDYMSRGVPDSVIVMRVSDRGPSVGWISDEITKVRNEAAHQAKVDAPTDGQAAPVAATS